MILVTRLNGPRLALNCDLIERAEETPDTILTLVDGTKYLVQESVGEIIVRIREFRASVLALANQIESGQAEVMPFLRLVPDRTGKD